MSNWQLTDLLLRDHCLVDKVLQLLVGKVDTELLKAVHSQVLHTHTQELWCHIQPTPPDDPQGQMWGQGTNLKPIDVHYPHCAVHLCGTEPVVDLLQQPVKQHWVQGFGYGISARGEEPQGQFVLQFFQWFSTYFTSILDCIGYCCNMFFMFLWLHLDCCLDYKHTVLMGTIWTGLNIWVKSLLNFSPAVFRAHPEEKAEPKHKRISSDDNRGLQAFSLLYQN